tara:strand:+ start:361 stop:3501 length:3141 start_codon:yes stop_codon:yes gene_type:complete
MNPTYSSLVKIYGPSATSAWATAAEACATGSSGTIIGTSSAGVWIQKEADAARTLANYLTTVSGASAPGNFYASGGPGIANSFGDGQFVYVEAQTITPAYDSVGTVESGVWQLRASDIGGLNFWGISGSGANSTLAEPLLCGVTASLDDYYLTRVTGTLITTGTMPYAALVVASGDDAVSAVTPLGFTFNFNRGDYTRFWVDSNGRVGLYTGEAPASLPTNDLEAADTRVILAPWWNDLKTVHGINYVTTGTVPYRTGVIGFSSQPYYNLTQPGLDFQVVLMETTNDIQFRYNVTSSADSGWITAPYGASIGVKVSTAGGSTSNIRDFLIQGYAKGGANNDTSTSASLLIGKNYPGDGHNNLESASFYFNFTPEQPPTPDADVINFVTGVYQQNYVTGGTQFTYGVLRTEAEAAPQIVKLGVTGTAVAGIDYEHITSSALTMSWGAGENSEKQITVNYEVNPAHTGTTFQLYIIDLGGGIAGTASTANSNIVYPGRLNFSSTGSTVIEGVTKSVTINRTSGTVGTIQAILEITGSAVSGTNYKLGNVIAMSPTESMLSFADGASTYTFDVITIDDSGDTSTLELNFDLGETEYQYVHTLNFPTASVGTGSGFNLFIEDNEYGELNLAESQSDRIWTGINALTWSIARGDGGDGAATGTVTLLGIGGYSAGVYGIDYTGSSGSFPYTFTWADQEQTTKTFSIQTLINPALTGVGITPYIDSSTGASIGSSRTFFNWITYPGSASFAAATSSLTEGQSTVVVVERVGGAVGQLTATVAFGGTATGPCSDCDYQTSSMTPAFTVRWGDGETTPSTSQIGISTVDDILGEDNETIVISLTGTTVYKFTTTSGPYTTNIGFATGSLIAAQSSGQTIIVDNETGTLNFSAASYTVEAGALVEVDVDRSGGAAGAVTATISQLGGAAVVGTDYTGLPVNIYWEDRVSGTTSFNISAINDWATDGIGINLGFTYITGSHTGSIQATSEVTITNGSINNEGPNPYPNISSDFVINTFRNMSAGYKRKGGQVPFSLGTRGPPTIRKVSSAYSTSLG